jgi:hypothetical protein
MPDSSPSPPPPSPWQHWFEAIWADREERVYADYFGDAGPGIYTLPASLFDALGHPSPDPRFLTHGVFECPPSPARPHWLYVTSGMSNPWGDTPDTVSPDRYSGLGYEFTLHTPDRAKWPLHVLHWVMAVQLLTAAGQLQGELLQRFDRIPLGGPIGTKDGQLTHLFVTSPDAPVLSPGLSARQPPYPPSFTLASGQVELLLLIGITARENDFAKAQGPEGLLTLLHHHDVFPLTTPTRPSLV